MEKVAKNYGTLVTKTFRSPTEIEKEGNGSAIQG